MEAEEELESGEAAEEVEAVRTVEAVKSDEAVKSVRTVEAVEAQESGKAIEAHIIFTFDYIHPLLSTAKLPFNNPIIQRAADFSLFKFSHFLYVCLSVRLSVCQSFCH